MIDVVLFGLLVPLLVAAAVYLAGWRPWASTQPPDNALVGVWAVLAAYLAGYVGLEGWPPLPPQVAGGWTVYAAIGAAALAHVDLALRKPVIGWVLRVALVVGILWGMFQTMFDPARSDAWSPTGGALRIAGYGVAILVVWAALESLAERRRDGSVPLALGLAAGVGGVAVILGGSLFRGVIGASLAFAVGLPFLVALWRGSAPVRGAVAVFVPVLGLIWSLAYVYDEIAGGTMLLVAVAPLLAWLGELPGLRPRALAAGAVRATAVLVVVGAAAGVAVMPAGEGGEAAAESEGSSSGSDSEDGEDEGDDGGTYKAY